MENNKIKSSLMSKIKQKYNWLCPAEIETVFNMAASDYMMIKFPSDTNRPKYEDFDFSDFTVSNWLYKRMVDILDRAGATNVTAYSENGLRIEYGSGYINDKLAAQILPRAGVPK